MRKNKGIAYLLLIAMVFAVLMLSGCSSEGGEQSADPQQPAGQSSDINPTGEKVTIGWSERALAGTPWFEAMVSAAEKLAAENNIELIVIDAQNKPDKQVADMEDLIARGVDGIVLDPCHPTAILTAVESANAAGIPIVGVNSAIDTSINPNARVETIITSDNYTIGYGVGYELGKKWDKPAANVVIMSGHMGDLEGWQRRNGFIAGFSEYQYEKFGAAKINVLAQRYAGDWDPDKALTQMQDVLVKFPGQIDVLFSEGDAMALSCVTALKSAGESDVLVGSIDAQLEAIEALKDGDIVAIGINSAVETGKAGIVNLMKVISGEDISTRIYLPSPTITQENVDEYYQPGVPFL